MAGNGLLKQDFERIIQDSQTKLIIFGGKGGVGKTTCASAASVNLAEKKKKVLLISSDPASSVSDIFQREIGGEITEINEYLSAVEIKPEQFSEEFQSTYGDLFYKIISSIIPVKKSDTEIIPDEIAPGVEELFLLAYIMNMLSEDYDAIVLDTAPTGHTMRLLHLPDQIGKYAKAGITLNSKISGKIDTIKVWFDMDTSEDILKNTLNELLSSVESIKNVLINPDITEFIPVMIPEFLSVSETVRLINELDLNKIQVKRLIINGITPQNNCIFCGKRRKMQKKYIDETIDKCGSKMQIITAPLFPEEIAGINSVAKFASEIFPGDESAIDLLQ
ncbi:ArsA family ATPase [Methanoplanus endosymbiosus]|uniref:ArsA family ATPase n=1 Tax=Methanoplanus endosymbiosus TaxID=33865 RepID=A0A9E7PQP0_9EURY|nr:ArsA family ATPase [Methanoplanus endosymbiosus]UUX93051.1 ArsA family ATPase [Methanoplanus endosymbiosus]